MRPSASTQILRQFSISCASPAPICDDAACFRRRSATSATLAPVFGSGVRNKRFTASQSVKTSAGDRSWPTADSLTQDGHRPCCGRKQTCCYWGRSDLHWGSMAPQNYGELEESAGILSAQRRRVVAELVRGTGIEVDDMPDGSDREDALVEPASSGGSMGCMCCSQAGNTPSVAASMPRRGWSW